MHTTRKLGEAVGGHRQRAWRLGRIDNPVAKLVPNSQPLSKLLAPLSVPLAAVRRIENSCKSNYWRVTTRRRTSVHGSADTGVDLPVF